MHLKRSASCEVLVKLREKSHSFTRGSSGAYCEYTVRIDAARRRTNNLGLSWKENPNSEDEQCTETNHCYVKDAQPEFRISRKTSCQSEYGNSSCEGEQDKKFIENKWRTLRRKISVQSQRPKKNQKLDDLDVPTYKHHLSMNRKNLYSSKDDNRCITDLLTNYSINGFDNDSELDGEDRSSEDTFLEESWTDVITEYEGMTKKEKIQQETIWELLITERNYLKKLRVIITVFKKCLENLQRKNVLVEVDLEKLFANITDVYNTNLVFWEEHLKHVTEDARATKMPIKPSQLQDSFASFEELFEPYIKYCMEESSCMKYLKHLKRENENFQEYLAWCENNRQCMRLELADLFVKPMQRVTKYALLLKAILSKTIDPEEVTLMENMIFQVERFVTRINTTLRLRSEQQKLEDVLERIEIYTPIEAANEEIERLMSENPYCNFDLHGNIPGLSEGEQRCILLEGPMKMIEKQGRCDVHAFLFTDVLLLAKTKKGNDKFRVIRQPFRLNKIRLHRSKDVGSFIFVYLNEYGVLVSAFALQVAPSELTKWMQAIERARKRYESARAGNGSTLDFFDDDLPALITPLTHPSTASPMVDRRSLVISDENRLNPSSIIKNELRTRSSETDTRPYNDKVEDTSVEPNVKRSFSDPKSAISYSVRERTTSKSKGRQRPKSLVNISDNDIVKWVLTSENRDQSGSLTSDISDDSQRSSGIGDSFRSINSDGGIEMKNYSNLPEHSKVAQLKARFENHDGDIPCHIEGSDDSSLNPSASNMSEGSLCLTGSRRVTPPDYMDGHLTIKEEEEHACHIEKVAHVLTPMMDSDKDTENDSSESIRTLHGSSTVRSSFTSDEIMKENYVHAASQTEDNLRNVETDLLEAGIQCDLILGEECSLGRKLSNDSFQELHMDILRSNKISNLELLITPINDNNSIQSDNLELQKYPTATPKCYNDAYTQYESEFFTKNDISTQCGDFIQLADAKKINEIDEVVDCEKVSETMNVNEDVQVEDKKERTYSKSVSLQGSGYSGHVSLLDMLIKSSDQHPMTSSSSDLSYSPIGTLKHSYSEANISSVWNPESPNIAHSRSRSDENQQCSSPDKKYRDSNGTYDFPGMRALQTLSESLESSLQHRLSISNPIVNQYEESSSKREANKNNSNGAKTGCNSPSLRKMVLMNNSPRIAKKDLSDASRSPRIAKVDIHNTDSMDSLQTPKKHYNDHLVSLDDEFDEDSFSENILSRSSTGHSSPKIRKRIDLSKLENKRYTWHDFDSMSALDRIEETKYGPGGRSSTLQLSSNKTFSKSTELVCSPKKTSLKKTIMKRLTDVLDRSDKSRTEMVSSFDLTDEKLSKKKSRKEKKKIKKEQRHKEKEEKKRTTSISSSISHGSSSFNSTQSPTYS